MSQGKQIAATRRAELEQAAEALDLAKPRKLQLLLAYVFDTVPAVEAETIAAAAWEADKNPVGLVGHRLRRYLEAKKTAPVGRWFHPTTEPEEPKTLASPEAYLRLLEV